MEVGEKTWPETKGVPYSVVLHWYLNTLLRNCRCLLTGIMQMLRKSRDWIWEIWASWYGNAGYSNNDRSVFDSLKKWKSWFRIFCSHEVYWWKRGTSDCVRIFHTIRLWRLQRVLYCIPLMSGDRLKLHSMSDVCSAYKLTSKVTKRLFLNLLRRSASLALSPQSSTIAATFINLFWLRNMNNRGSMLDDTKFYDNRVSARRDTHIILACIAP